MARANAARRERQLATLTNMNKNLLDKLLDVRSSYDVVRVVQDFENRRKPAKLPSLASSGLFATQQGFSINV